MLSFGKKKMQARSVVEDAMKDEHHQQYTLENKTLHISRDYTKLKSLAAPLVIIVIALVLVGVMLLKIVALSSEVGALKTRVATSESLQSRIERIEKELDALRNRMPEKQARVLQRENREAAEKKVPSSNAAKKRAKPRT